MMGDAMLFFDFNTQFPSVYRTFRITFDVDHFIVSYGDKNSTATVAAPARAFDDFLIHNLLTEFLNVEVTFPGKNGPLPGMLINSQPIRPHLVPILHRWLQFLDLHLFFLVHE